MEDYIMILLAFSMDSEVMICKIKKNNVDLVNGTLTYHEKKKAKDRTIPIEPDVITELKRYINTLSPTQQFLLPFQDGTTAWRHLQDLCKLLG